MLLGKHGYQKGVKWDPQPCSETILQLPTARMDSSLTMTGFRANVDLATGGIGSEILGVVVQAVDREGMAKAPYIHVNCR